MCVKLSIYDLFQSGKKLFRLTDKQQRIWLLDAIPAMIFLLQRKIIDGTENFILTLTIFPFWLYSSLSLIIFFSECLAAASRTRPRLPRIRVTIPFDHRFHLGVDRQ